MARIHLALSLPLSLRFPLSLLPHVALSPPPSLPPLLLDAHRSVCQISGQARAGAGGTLSLENPDGGGGHGQTRASAMCGELPLHYNYLGNEKAPFYETPRRSTNDFSNSRHEARLNQ